MAANLYYVTAETINSTQCRALRMIKRRRNLQEREANRSKHQQEEKAAKDYKRNKKS
jgi:hypothetical protein